MAPVIVCICRVEGHHASPLIFGLLVTYLTYAYRRGRGGEAADELRAGERKEGLWGEGAVREGAAGNQGGARMKEKKSTQMGGGGGGVVRTPM